MPTPWIQYDEESGLYYYRARYYDPGTGRFLQKDPHPGKLNVPISVVNSYTYVGNNPIMRTDPSGLSWLGDFFATLGAIIFSPAILLVGLIVLPFDRAMGLSLLAIGFEFLPPVWALNAILNGVQGNGPSHLTFFEGTPYVKNSFYFHFSDAPGFSLGFANFIAPGLSREKELETMRHEFGHTLQYRAWGGNNFIATGNQYKGEYTWFEFDADARASAYFGTSVCSYHAYNHPFPQCRY